MPKLMRVYMMFLAITAFGLFQNCGKTDSLASPSNLGNSPKTLTSIAAEYTCAISSLTMGPSGPVKTPITTKTVKPAPSMVGDIHQTGTVTYHLDNQNLFSADKTTPKVSIVVMNNFMLQASAGSTTSSIELNDWINNIYIKCDGK